MTIIKADQRHFSNQGWLKTYWLFSFSNYYDPENIQFGALRVFNDDVVVGDGEGFPMHPHQEMEIITLVLDGEITHEDSMGNKTVIRPGEVQRLSAGTGITHSEFNLGKVPVHLYQIWILPGQKRLKPSYDQKRFDPEQWHNHLLPVASGQKLDGSVSFHADATIYRCRLDSGKNISLPLRDNRGIFIYPASGELSVNGENLRAHDQARIGSGKTVNLGAVQTTEFILIDVPKAPG